MKTPSVAKPPDTSLPLPNMNETGVDTQYAVAPLLAVVARHFEAILRDTEDVQQADAALNRPPPGLDPP